MTTQEQMTWLINNGYEPSRIFELAIASLYHRERQDQAQAFAHAREYSLGVFFIEAETEAEALLKAESRYGDQGLIDSMGWDAGRYAFSLWGTADEWARPQEVS